jgi:CBS domain-containing protein
VAFTALLWLGLTNLILAVFNLLPGAPLDGGRVVRAAVWKGTGDRRRAVRAAATSGQVLGVVLMLAGLADVLLLGRFSGLWLALVGWFLIAAAGVERRHSELRETIGELAVRAVMTLDPVVAPGWWTVAAFLERIAATTRHRAFPVVSFDGTPLGVVSLADLARLSGDERMVTRLSDACRTPPSVSIVPAGTPVTEVLNRAPLREGRDLLLVTENASLVGVVSADDLDRTVELAALRGP